MISVSLRRNVKAALQQRDKSAKFPNKIGNSASNASQGFPYLTRSKKSALGGAVASMPYISVPMRPLILFSTIIGSRSARGIPKHDKYPVRPGTFP